MLKDKRELLALKVPRETLVLKVLLALPDLLDLRAHREKRETKETKDAMAHKDQKETLG